MFLQVMRVRVCVPSPRCRSPRATCTVAPTQVGMTNPTGCRRRRGSPPPLWRARESRTSSAAVWCARPPPHPSLCTASPPKFPTAPLPGPACGLDTRSSWWVRHDRKHHSDSLILFLCRHDEPITNYICFVNIHPSLYFMWKKDKEIIWNSWTRGDISGLGGVWVEWRWFHFLCCNSTRDQAMKAGASLWHHQAAAWHTSGPSPSWSARGRGGPATTSPTSIASGWPGRTPAPPCATSPTRWSVLSSRGTSPGAESAWRCEEAPPPPP